MSAIIHDNWYIITDSKEVMYAHLPTLCQTASKSAATTTPTRWQVLANMPLTDTTAIALSGVQNEEVNWVTTDSVVFVLVLGNGFTQHAGGLSRQWALVGTGFPRCPKGMGS